MNGGFCEYGTKEEETAEVFGNAIRNFSSASKDDIKNAIAVWAVNRYHIKTISETGEMMLYNKKTGLYAEDETYVVTQIQKILDCAKLSPLSTTNFVSECIELIKRRTYVKKEDFDAPPYLIPFRNGILDWRPNGLGFFDYSPEYRFLSKLNVDYNPNAKCPEFDWFLREITGNEDDIIRIYQMIGYCFIRDYPIHRAFMLIGEGSNGKSVLLKTIEEILGRDNVSHLSLQQLESEKFAIDSLRGKFANIYADLSSTELRTTGRFKNLTSGDPILVEKKYGGTYSLRNTAKFIFSCNQLPGTRDDTDAYYRRWVIVPFPNQFIDGVNADPEKLKKITTEEEKSGIINESLLWLERLYLTKKFYKEEDIDVKRDKYRRLSSSILAYIDDCIEYSAGYIVKDDLYKSYLTYCTRHHLPPSSEKKFFSTVQRELNVEEQRVSTMDGRKRVYMGIGFKKDIDI